MLEPHGSEWPAGRAAHQGPLGLDMARQLAVVIGNAGVLTALLIYFGWRRSETQNQRLGFDESILGLSTQEYILRSVGPVLEMLAAVAVLGLMWLLLDRFVTRNVEGASQPESRARRWSWVAILLAIALPPVAGGALLVLPYSSDAFVAWPVAWGLSALLLLYAGRLRQIGRSRRSTSSPARALAVLAVCISLFWAASNRAEVLGNEFADEFAANIPRSLEVTVYSTERLHIDAPGVIEQVLRGDDGGYRFRYTGLRFLEHIGDRYFLVSDGWTPQYGVIIILRDDEELRLEFIRRTAAERGLAAPRASQSPLRFGLPAVTRIRPRDPIG